jgi:hypothetical protein
MHGENMKLAVVKTEPETESPATKNWGYEFGVDGLWNLEQVSEHLGGMGRSTIERLVDKGKLRRGKQGRVYFCRRSVIEFAKSIEQ